jgi:hypothetical protein
MSRRPALKATAKAEKSSTAGTAHVAHSVNDNEKISGTKNVDQVGKEHAGHSNKKAPEGALM